MEICKFISSLLLTTITSSTFALNNQEIVTLLNQQAKSSHHAPHNKHISSTLNWESLHGPQLSTAVNILQMKNNSSMLFAFRPFSVGGINKSTDGGQTWKTISIPKNIFMFDLISVDENHLLLAADQSIYSSTDQGEHWTLSANLNRYGYKLFALNSNLIFLATDIHSASASLLRSLDGGKTWSPARLGLDTEYSLRGLGGRDNLLLVGTVGLNVSTNNGVIWSQPEKWKGHGVASLAVSSKHDIFFTDTSSLYKTDAQGLNLEEIKNSIFKHIDDIKIDNRDNIYIITHTYNPDDHSYLYQSTDQGKTWKLLKDFSHIYHLTTLDNGKIIVSTNEGLLQYDEKLESFAKLPITFSVSETIKVLALDQNNLFALDGSSSGILYGSHDGGKTWTSSHPEKVRDLGTLNDSLIKTEWKHLSTSNDKGQTWQEINSPGKECESISSQQDALILDCSDGQYLTRDLSHWKTLKNYGKNYVYGHSIYSSNRKSIKYSNDDGQTWKTLLDNLNDYGTHITGYQDKIVLVAAYEAGIIKTSDGGTTWDLMNNGIEDYQFSDIKALDENNYIATTKGGVYITSDGGKHWTAENTGLDNIEIKSLFINQDMLLVGTNGSGVFKASLKNKFVAMGE